MSAVHVQQYSVCKLAQIHLHMMHARAAEPEQYAALEGIANTAYDGQPCASIKPIQLYKSSLPCAAVRNLVRL